MARKSLTDKGIAALKPRAARYAFPDPQLASHYVRVTPGGAKSFCCVARAPDGRQIWTTIGDCEVMPIEQARTRAREMLQRVRDGKPAVEADKPSFKAIVEKWIEIYAEPKKLRSLPNIRRLLAVHVYSHPRFKDRPFVDIEREDITELLDEIQTGSGARQADLVLTILRSIMNWHATRTNKYRSPIVRGMSRDEAQPRERILNDDEIRTIWKSAGSAGRFGAIAKLCLLTGQRRSVIGKMQWDHISPAGTWDIPLEPREKDNAGMLALPAVALDIIRSQPKLAGNPYVFGSRDDKPFCGYSLPKREFDDKLPKMPRWTLHDCRRTARSLLSRAGIRPDIAERTLGHAIRGTEKIYDRHHYGPEKKHALAALANLIDGIVNPRDNVTRMRKRAKR
jgi:integrase